MRRLSPLSVLHGGLIPQKIKNDFEEDAQLALDDQDIQRLSSDKRTKDIQ
ncbi:Cytochrome c oxidase subunit CcoQ [Moraxella catarrhalis]|nr:Cytochrome c oxidase subunit CcoQ [Moraxella catarrhalis]